LGQISAIKIAIPRLIGNAKIIDKIDVKIVPIIGTRPPNSSLTGSQVALKRKVNENLLIESFASLNRTKKIEIKISINKTTERKLNPLKTFSIIYECFFKRFKF